jgi:hypothetical protein
VGARHVGRNGQLQAELGFSNDEIPCHRKASAFASNALCSSSLKMGCVASTFVRRQVVLGGSAGSVVTFWRTRKLLFRGHVIGSVDPA